MQGVEEKGIFLNLNGMEIAHKVRLVNDLSCIAHGKDFRQPGGWKRPHTAAGRSPPMPPRILPILERLRQDQSSHLAPDAIRDACRKQNDNWRQRLLDPVTIIYLFLLQILHGTTGDQHFVQFGCWPFTDCADCQARKRSPLGV
jgi:hypothetical protein